MQLQRVVQKNRCVSTCVQAVCLCDRKGLVSRRQDTLNVAARCAGYVSECTEQCAAHPNRGTQGVRTLRHTPVMRARLISVDEQRPCESIMADLSDRNTTPLRQAVTDFPETHREPTANPPQ